MTLQRVIGAAGVALGLIITGESRAPAEPIESAADGWRVPTVRSAREVIFDQPASHTLLQNALGVRGQPRAQRVRIDMQPVLDEITGFLRAHGFPLHEDSELVSHGGIAFSAAVRGNDDLPSMPFTIGDRGPFHAFYANDGGFRSSLKWPLPPIPQFSLHLGGGEDSEFGNWAVVGVQWLHPRRALAIGVGMPIALQHADGAVGVICQLRMLLT